MHVFYFNIEKSASKFYCQFNKKNQLYHCLISILVILLLKVLSPNESIWKTTFKFLFKLNFYVANLAYLEIVYKIRELIYGQD